MGAAYHGCWRLGVSGFEEEDAALASAAALRARMSKKDMSKGTILGLDADCWAKREVGLW